MSDQATGGAIFVELTPEAAVKELVAFIQRRYAVRSKHERERLLAAVARVETLLAEITYGFDGTSPERRQWCRRELQIMYERVSSLVPVPSKHGYDRAADLLVNMIACGRIYYWLRTFDGNRSFDGLSASDLRSELDRDDVTRSYAASVASLLKQVLDGRRLSSSEYDEAREMCAEVIIQGQQALLEALGA